MLNTAAAAATSRDDYAVQVIRAEWDDQGIYVYQAFRDDIADWALAHQKFAGCPYFLPHRMTWVKPSFAWMLYRSGYGKKPGQQRLLKIKLSHETLACLLCQCKCTEDRTSRDRRPNHDDCDVEEDKTQCDAQQAKECAACESSDPVAHFRKVAKGSGGSGRVQWDPERDLFSGNGKEPTKLLRMRSIQIGLAGSVSQEYASNILSITEVTALGHKVCAAHSLKTPDAQRQAMQALMPELPVERPYMPLCPDSVLAALAMLPGPVADAVRCIGRGRVPPR